MFEFKRLPGLESGQAEVEKQPLPLRYLVIVGDMQLGEEALYAEALAQTVSSCGRREFAGESAWVVSVGDLTGDPRVEALQKELPQNYQPQLAEQYANWLMKVYPDRAREVKTRVFRPDGAINVGVLRAVATEVICGIWDPEVNPENSEAKDKVEQDRFTVRSRRLVEFADALGVPKVILVPGNREVKGYGGAEKPDYPGAHWIRPETMAEAREIGIEIPEHPRFSVISDQGLLLVPWGKNRLWLDSTAKAKFLARGMTGESVSKMTADTEHFARAIATSDVSSLTVVSHEPLVRVGSKRGIGGYWLNRGRLPGEETNQGLYAYFTQPNQGLFFLLRQVKRINPEMDIWVFSGHAHVALEEFMAGNVHSNSLLDEERRALRMPVSLGKGETSIIHWSPLHNGEVVYADLRALVCERMAMVDFDESRAERVAEAAQDSLRKRKK